MKHLCGRDRNSKEIFKFTVKNREKIKKVIAIYPKGREKSAVLPVLYLAQEQNGGFLDISAMDCVANLLGMSFISVYEVASFYTMFYLHPVGKNIVKVCTSPSCFLRGSDEVLSFCKKRLKDGKTNEKNPYTLLEVGCLGACINAPVIQINDVFYENVTLEQVKEILKKASKDEVLLPLGDQGKSKTLEESKDHG